MLDTRSNFPTLYISTKKYHLEAGTGIDIIPGNRMPQRYGNKVPKNKMFQRNLAPHLFDIDYEGDYPDYIDKDFFKDKKYINPQAIRCQ